MYSKGVCFKSKCFFIILGIRILRFFADGMLGKLTRWLRIMGFDVVYGIENDDKTIINKVKIEKRILLTSDFELYNKVLRQGSKAIFINEKNIKEKLTCFSKTLKINLRINMSTSRCPLCNGKISKIAKNK